jgi:glyoxylate reductase
MKIFITRKLIGKAEQLLEEKGYKVKVFDEDRAISKEELLKESRDVDALITLLSDKIDKEVINNLSQCKIIANCAVGFNNIDIELAKKKNIVVTNTPDILTDATADLTVALVLGCARRLHEGELMMRSNQFTGWQPQLLLGIGLKNKIVGVIGAGRIGYAVAKRLQAFGTKIVYFNRTQNKKLEKDFSAKKFSLNKLLSTADIISLHLPLTPETHYLLNESNLKLLKPTAILINTARGEIIQEKVLVELLKQKKIFAAGFDVYEGEPDVNPELLTLDNVFLLPHIGSAAIETRSAMSELCVKNIIKVFNGKKALTPVL